MPAKINLLNQQIGDLLVIKETDKRKNKSIVWQCRCKCNNIEEFSTKELRSDGIIQCHKCGTKRRPQANLMKNLIGEKFNHLTVIEATDRRCGGKIVYKCICDCEKQTEVFTTRTELENNNTISCGCAKRKYTIGDIINNREIIGYVGCKYNDGHYYYKCKCLLCQSEYEALGQTLEKTISCGCQKSIGEYNIIQVLLQHNIPFIREYKFPNSAFRFDFAILNSSNKKVIRLVEFDGEQHYKEQIKNSGWNTYQKYQYTLQNDLLKNDLAKSHNISLVRIPYWERDNITLELIFSNKYQI